MFIPIGTDAPIYHRPWGTLSLIAIGIVVFFMVDASEPNTWWTLNHGSVNPVTLLTSSLSHADFLHLFGNMIFLYVFGLVIEGKLGWIWLIGLFMGISLCANTVEAVLMFWSDSWSLGASGVIFGFMVICLFWAPLNKVDTLIIMFPRGFNVQFPIWGLVLFYVLWDLLLSIFTGFQMSSVLLHTLGALTGALPAWYLLKRDLMDCEGWDLLTIFQRRRDGLDISAMALNKAYRLNSMVLMNPLNQNRSRQINLRQPHLTLPILIQRVSKRIGWMI